MNTIDLNSLTLCQPDEVIKNIQILWFYTEGNLLNEQEIIIEINLN